MQQLDHVGIVVSDLTKSISWYQKVLGLIKLDYPKWDDYPVMMSGGDSTIALFQKAAPPKDLRKFFHFAFRVNTGEYEDLKDHLENIKQAYREEDHYYFRSIYLIDPDGYEVEMTTEVKNP